MNLDKAKKRIAKQIKKGDNGYPKVSLQYFGQSDDCASHVIITFTLDENTPAQEQQLTSESNTREDETIQSTIVKIIERADAKTVAEVAGITLLT